MMKAKFVSNDELMKETIIAMGDVRTGIEKIVKLNGRNPHCSNRSWIVKRDKYPKDIEGWILLADECGL